jgi:hypothetical protein
LRHKRPFPQLLFLTQAVWIDGTEFNWSKKEIAAAYQGHYRFLPNGKKRRPSPDDGDGEFDRLFARV